MLLGVAMESERNRVLRHNARGAPVRRSAVRNERNLVGRRPPSKRLVGQRNKSDAAVGLQQRKRWWREALRLSATVTA
jgi:hypothetical protein